MSPICRLVGRKDSGSECGFWEKLGWVMCPGLLSAEALALFSSRGFGFVADVVPAWPCCQDCPMGLACEGPELQAGQPWRGKGGPRSRGHVTVQPRLLVVLSLPCPFTSLVWVSDV